MTNLKVNLGHIHKERTLCVFSPAVYHPSCCCMRQLWLASAAPNPLVTSPVIPQSPTLLRQNVQCVILVTSDIRCHYEWNKHRFYVQCFSISAPALWALEEQCQNWRFVLVRASTIALSQTVYLSTKNLLTTWLYLIWYVIMVWYANVVPPGGGFKTC